MKTMNDATRNIFAATTALGLPSAPARWLTSCPIAYTSTSSTHGVSRFKTSLETKVYEPNPQRRSMPAKKSSARNFSRRTSSRMASGNGMPKAYSKSQRIWILETSVFAEAWNGTDESTPTNPAAKDASAVSLSSAFTSSCAASPARKKKNTARPKIQSANSRSATTTSVSEESVLQRWHAPARPARPAELPRAARSRILRYSGCRNLN